MKLASLIDERFGLPGNVGRDFGEKFLKDFIEPGKFAELWTSFEATYPELQPELQSTFEKTNELLRYIKPEQGDETYRVSSMPEAAAQELDNLLHNILETLEFVSSQNEEPGIEMVKSVVKDFDNIFEDMLNIFTSNTAGDKPLEPYKQTDMGFRSSQYTEKQIREVIKKILKEEFLYNEDFWKGVKNVAKAILPRVPSSVKRVAKNIARSPLSPRLTKDYKGGKRTTDDENQWSSWDVSSFGGIYDQNKKKRENALIKHGVSKEKSGQMSFSTYEDILLDIPDFSLKYTGYPYKKKETITKEQIREIIKSTLLEIDYKLPGEKEAEAMALKTKQIVKKTGEELGNLAKDIYDTPTIKRLRAYIKSELDKLAAKYGVDGTSKYAPKSSHKDD